MKRKNEAQSYYGTVAALLLVIYVAVSLFISFILLVSNALSALPIVLIAFGVVLIIPTIIYFVLYLHYKNAEYINIQSVRFTSIEFSAFSRELAALVGTAIVDGEEIRITTSYTFNTRYYSSHCASSYMDKTVTVGYDPKWDKWVVIEDK